MVEGAMGQYRQLRQTPAPSIFGVDTGPPHEGDTGQGVVLHTSLGPIKAILHQSAQGGVRAVLWVWGARGGYAGPAEGVFAHLAEAFSAQGLTSLRLHYRHPGVYVESVLDVRAGLAFLKGRGCSRVVLVGHSFGGAVVIAAGTLTDQVVAVVSLSPQTYGAQGAVYVAPRPLLLVHGLADTRLPPAVPDRFTNGPMSPRSWCSILGPSMDCGNVRGSCMPCCTDGYRRSWALIERSTRAVQHKSTALRLWWR